MPGVWSIEDSALPAVDEYAAFSHSIVYTNSEFPSSSYTVVLEPQETNPDTIYVSGNNITGYYTNVFNVRIVYKTPKDEYLTVNNFRLIDSDKLAEVVEYNPDLTPNKTYTYIAKAYDNLTNEVFEIKTYTKIVNNNWDLNKNLLIQYVNSTVVTDSSLFRDWINSINAAKVKWRNSSNVEINWA
jgi:hypothetical protein